MNCAQNSTVFPTLVHVTTVQYPFEWSLHVIHLKVTTSKKATVVRIKAELIDTTQNEHKFKFLCEK